VSRGQLERYASAGVGPWALLGGASPIRNHGDVLGDSPFSSIDRSTWSWTRQLGDRAEAFVAEVREAVIGLHPSGLVTEPFRVEVLLATRP
jgi:hypothetical protein